LVQSGFRRIHLVFTEECVVRLQSLPGEAPAEVFTLPVGDAPKEKVRLQWVDGKVL
jgi:hypothetical protein